MIVISDSSPLNHLAASDYLDLLKTMYGQIIIPVAVDEEIRLKCKDEKVRSQILDATWIVSQHALDRKLVTELDEKLGGAEAEAIALAVELNADLLLIDERKGRTVAKQFNLKTGGVLSVLIEAKEQHLVTEVVPIIQKMMNETGFRISEELFDDIRKITGE
jgi:predicted nucleic acid-binding protein